MFIEEPYDETRETYMQIYRIHTDKIGYFQSEDEQMIHAANCRIELLKDYPQVAFDNIYWEKIGQIYSGVHDEELLFQFTANYVQAVVDNE